MFGTDFCFNNPTICVVSDASEFPFILSNDNRDEANTSHIANELQNANFKTCLRLFSDSHTSLILS